MFKFDAFDPNEIEDNGGRRPLAPGVASFRIIEANDTNQDGSPKISKAGNHQIEIVYEVTDIHGNKGKMWDYFPSHIQWKIRSLLAAVDRVYWCKSGALAPSSLINLKGQCILKKDEGNVNYPGKVKIANYVDIKQSESVNSYEHKTLEVDDLDGIPF